MLSLAPGIEWMFSCLTNQVVTLLADNLIKLWLLSKMKLWLRLDHGGASLWSLWLF